MKDRSTGYMPRNYTSDRRERHSLLAVQLEAACLMTTVPNSSATTASTGNWWSSRRPQRPRSTSKGGVYTSSTRTR